MGSRVDLSSSAVACSSGGAGSTSSLSALGRQVPMHGQTGSPRRFMPGSAPATPRGTPPASPQHWPRRYSAARPAQLPATPHPPSQLATVKSEATTPIT